MRIKIITILLILIGFLIIIGIMQTTRIFAESTDLVTFILHKIDNYADGAYSVIGIDMDGDMDNDVLASTSNDDEVLWNEYPAFSPHIIDPFFNSYANVSA